MARKRGEINPNSAINLKMLCVKYGITQARLSELTGVSQNTVSGIVTGKVAMSYPVAQEIAKQFSGVLIEWLMGSGEDMTEEERVKRITNVDAEALSKSFETDQRRRLCLKELINVLGYDIVGDGFIFDEGTGSFVLCSDDPSFYVVSPDGERAAISYRELQFIVGQIISLAKAELEMPFNILWPFQEEKLQNG